MPNIGGVGWADPSAIPPNSSFSRELAGVVVNDLTAMQITSVMACIRLISGIIGGLPIKTYRQQALGKLKRIENPTLVTNPFDEVDVGEGIEGGIVSLMTRGNAYYQVLHRDNRGTPDLLLPLSPHTVEVRRKNGQRVYKVNHQPVPTSDMLHLRWLTLPGACVGLAPIEYAAMTMGISLAAEEYGARFFAQGASLSGILTTDGTLTKEQARRMAKDFLTHHGGLGQSHLPLVLEGGLKFQPVSVPPEQAQFLATRQYQRGEIAMLYGVPPHLLGDTDRSTSWGKGIQDQKMDFVTFTLARYSRRFEAAWSQVLPRNQVIRFDYDGLLRANMVDRFNAYIVARTAGFLNAEEIREMEYLEPSGDPDLSNFTLPLNSAPKPPVIKGDTDGGDGPE